MTAVMIDAMPMMLADDDCFEQFVQFNELSDDELSDDELSDDELPDDEMTDDELSDDELSDDELLDDEMTDDEFLDDELPDDELSDDEFRVGLLVSIVEALGSRFTAMVKSAPSETVVPIAISPVALLVTWRSLPS